MASNFNNFGVAVGYLSNLQAFLANGQGNNASAWQDLSKTDDDVDFDENNALDGSNFAGDRDFESRFNGGDNDRVPGGGLAGNEGEEEGGNKQNTYGLRPTSDSILIKNVCTFLNLYTTTNTCVCLFINIKIIVTAPIKCNMANVEKRISKRWRGEICCNTENWHRHSTIRIWMGCCTRSVYPFKEYANNIDRFCLFKRIRILNSTYRFKDFS